MGVGGEVEEVEMRLLDVRVAARARGRGRAAEPVVVRGGKGEIGGAGRDIGSEEVRGDNVGSFPEGSGDVRHRIWLEC